MPTTDFDALRALIHKHGLRGARSVARRQASRRHIPPAQRRAALRSVTAAGFESARA
jgi:hypothetical protein